MLVLFILLLVIIIYLGVVSNYVFYLNLYVDYGFSLLEGLLKERFDFIPEVVSVFKGQVKDDQLLEELILIHNRLYHKLSRNERIELDFRVVSILEQLTEGYDYEDLDLLRDLHSLQEKIDEEKFTYNQSLEELKQFLSKRPHCLVGSLLNLDDYLFYKA